MRQRRTAWAVVALTAALGLGACAGGPNSSGDPWIPPAPELASLSATDAEVANAIIRNSDLGRRMVLEDLGRAVFADRPSRLNRKAIPY